MNEEALAKAKVLCAVLEDPDSFTNPEETAKNLVSELEELVGVTSSIKRLAIEEVRAIREAYKQRRSK